MKMTLAEAENQLVTVNAAINSLLSGNKITQLRVGSGTFQRLYVYQEITLDELRKLRAELLAIIDTLSPVEKDLSFFGKSATFPLIAEKSIW